MKKIVFSLAMMLCANAVELDKETGLKIAEGFEEVKANCTVCHSSAFIIQSKLNRDGWLGAIRWMQETQGLWEFDERTEDVILTYLSTQYPDVGTSRRRVPLPAELMPAK